MANQYEIQIDQSSGLVDAYTTEDLDNLSGVFAVDLVGDELTVDTLTLCISVDPGAIEFIAPADYDQLVSEDDATLATNWAETRDPLALEHGAAVRAYRNGALFARGFFDDAEQTGPDMYQINVVSPVGMLLNRAHHGGIYTGESFGQVCADIIGDAFPFTMDDDVAELAIYGWLPYVNSARDNLHQLLFACGVSMLRDEFGDAFFCFLFDSEAGTLEDAMIYRDNGSIKHSAPATQVSVTEHTFEALDGDERVTVFDNTDGSGTADRQLVTFSDAPIHHLEAAGTLVIHEQGVNYAIVSGKGTLTGQRYTHITQIVTADNDVAGQAQNVIAVSNMTLVSFVNSENVAKRVLAYNIAKRIIKVGLVFHDERCGRKYAFNDPWGSPVTAFLASMTLTMSNIIKADAELIAGYVPTGQGNNFTHIVVLTDDGSWTVPEGAETLRVVLIGGGQDGDDGADGEAGEDGSFTSRGPYTSIEDEDLAQTANGGKGGGGGSGGTPGKVLVATLETHAGEVYSYAAAAAGGESAFGTLTSADGTAAEAGYTELFSGKRYAAAGRDGVDGGSGSGAGGDGGSVTARDGTVYRPGADGADAAWSHSSGGTFFNTKLGGGFGGGAAEGSDGGSGGNAYRGTSSYPYDFDTGDGGRGADALPGEDGASFGCGGSGGSGGGGGGGGGSLLQNGNMTFPNNYGKGGAGGKGSRGGKGAPGCIIIYY